MIKLFGIDVLLQTGSKKRGIQSIPRLIPRRTPREKVIIKPGTAYSSHIVNISLDNKYLYKKNGKQIRHDTFANPSIARSVTRRTRNTRSSEGVMPNHQRTCTVRTTNTGGVYKALAKPK